MNIYNCEVMVCMTAYVRADSPEAAMAKLKAIDGTSDCLHPDSEIPISGLQLDDPALPEISVSPAFTLHGPWNEETTCELIEANVAPTTEEQMNEDECREALEEAGWEYCLGPVNAYYHKGKDRLVYAASWADLSRKLLAEV